MRLPRAAAALLALTLAAPAMAAPGFVPIDIVTRPIDSFSFAAPQDWLGEIEFRGGLSLDSSNADFGAISGLDVAADGSFVAVLDTGFWLHGQLLEEAGRLVGVAGAELAPLLDEDGQEAGRKFSADAESVRIDYAAGIAYVAFEQDHRVERFAIADLGLARPTRVSLPRLTGIRGNEGIEAVAVAPAGTRLAGSIVIIAEQSANAWIVGGANPGQFSVRRNDNFAVTDAAFLPNGDLLILERRFSLSEGVAMRIRRLSSDDIRPGGVATGPTLVIDENLFQIDNMEGLSLRPQADGSVVINLLSDDNHNLLQRTLLLQFVWRDVPPPLPVPRPPELGPIR